MKQAMIKLAVACGLMGAVAMTAAPQASAIDLWKGCSGASQSAVCKGKGDEVTTPIKNLINTAMILLGITAVIAIIVGGFKFITANGDSGAVQSAKNIILYAVIGLIVALLAWAIVSFVVNGI